MCGSTSNLVPYTDQQLESRYQFSCLLAKSKSSCEPNLTENVSTHMNGKCIRDSHGRGYGSDSVWLDLHPCKPTASPGVQQKDLKPTELRSSYGDK